MLAVRDLKQARDKESAESLEGTLPKIVPYLLF
jgi:hypothetical protein